MSAAQSACQITLDDSRKYSRYRYPFLFLRCGKRCKKNTTNGYHWMAVSLCSSPFKKGVLVVGGEGVSMWEIDCKYAHRYVCLYILFPVVLGLDLPSNMQVCIFIFFFSLLPFSLSTIIIMRVSTNIIFMNPILSINCVIVMIFYSLSLFSMIYMVWIESVIYKTVVSNT